MKPDYNKVKIEVQKIFDDFLIKEPPIKPREIAHAIGIEIIRGTFKLDINFVSGAYDAKAGKIYINSDDHPYRQQFTMAHELGHAVLHKEWALSQEYQYLFRDPTKNNFNNHYEKEANEFAGQLLVPRFMLDAYKDRFSKADLSTLFCVSLDVIHIRLNKEYGQK